MTDVEKLQERVANGIDWLVAHDPTGAFHLWFVARISPKGPFPAHEDDGVPEAYAEYHKQRTNWERLSSALERVDPLWHAEPGQGLWQGDPGRIRTR